jgi:aminopeptidase YwaD
MRTKHFLLALMAALIWHPAITQVPADFSITAVRDHIDYLASESLKGRKTGTPETLLAAEYIREQFHTSGLKLLSDNGFQHFDVVTGIALGEKNILEIDGQSLTSGEDFTPLPFSKNGNLSARVVFAGYGFDISGDDFRWNDYKNADVTGKWAILLRGAPQTETGSDNFSGSTDERFKVMIAQDNGAAGVIFISGEKLDKDDELLPLSYDRSPAASGIPVIHLKRSIADQFLSDDEMQIATLEENIIQNMEPNSFELSVTITANVDLKKEHVTAQNVVAMIEGSDPDIHDQYLVIGAHYDHLGMGGQGSGSRTPDTLAVHYGADDNASGVAGMIELARYFSSLDEAPARSIVFAAFDAEEMGLIGSRHFVNEPLIDLEKVTAMINFDMIGRLRDNNTILVGGTGTSSETEAILDRLTEKYPLTLNYAQEGFGPSDHASFYSKDIPVIFISTGAHADYHTPRDHPSGINAEGMVSVLDFCAGLVDRLSNRDEMLTFQEAGPSSRTDHRYSFKVTLGIMPDMTSSGSDGLRVDAVRPGAPAASGGMQKGDIITAIDGNPVGNIYDYMGRLKNLEPGQMITVDVLRNGETEVLIIQL